jgi:hypothetical protein
MLLDSLCAFVGKKNLKINSFGKRAINTSNQPRLRFVRPQAIPFDRRVLISFFALFSINAEFLRA